MDAEPRGGPRRDWDRVDQRAQLERGAGRQREVIAFAGVDPKPAAVDVDAAHCSDAVGLEAGCVDDALGAQGQRGARGIDELESRGVFDRGAEHPVSRREQDVIRLSLGR